MARNLRPAFGKTPISKTPVPNALNPLFVEKSDFKDLLLQTDEKSRFTEELQRRYHNQYVVYYDSNQLIELTPIVQFYLYDGNRIFKERETLMGYIKYIENDLFPGDQGDIEASIKKQQAVPRREYYVIPTREIWKILLVDDLNESTKFGVLTKERNNRENALTRYLAQLTDKTEAEREVILLTKVNPVKAEIEQLNEGISKCSFTDKEDVLQYYKLANAFLEAVTTKAKKNALLPPSWIGYPVLFSDKDIQDKKRAFYNFLRDKPIREKVPVFGNDAPLDRTPGPMSVDTTYNALFSAFAAVVEAYASGKINTGPWGLVFAGVIKLALFDWLNPIGYQTGNLAMPLLRYRLGLVGKLKGLTHEAAELGPRMVLNNEQFPDADLTPDQINMIKAYLDENEYLMAGAVTDDDKARRLQSMSLSLKSYVVSEERLEFREKLIYALKLLGRDICIDLGVKVIMRAWLTGDGLQFEFVHFLFLLPFVLSEMTMGDISPYTKWAMNLIEHPLVQWVWSTSLPGYLARALFTGGVLWYTGGVVDVTKVDVTVLYAMGANAIGWALEALSRNLTVIYEQCFSKVMNEAILNPDFVRAMAIRLTTSVITMGTFASWVGRVGLGTASMVEAVTLALSSMLLAMEPEYFLRGDQSYTITLFLKTLTVVALKVPFAKAVDKYRKRKAESGAPLFKAVPLDQISITTADLQLSKKILAGGLMVAAFCYLSGETNNRLISEGPETWGEMQELTTSNEGGSVAIMNTEWVETVSKRYPGVKYDINPIDGAWKAFARHQLYGGIFQSVVGNETTYRAESPHLNFTFTHIPLGTAFKFTLQELYAKLDTPGLVLTDVMESLNTSEVKIEQNTRGRENLIRISTIGLVWFTGNQMIAWLRSRMQNWTVDNKRAVMRVAKLDLRKYAMGLKQSVFTNKASMYTHIFGSVIALSHNGDSFTTELKDLMRGNDQDPSVQKFKSNVFSAIMTDSETVKQLLDFWHPTHDKNFFKLQTNWNHGRYVKVLQFIEKQSPHIRNELMESLIKYLQALFYNTNGLTYPSLAQEVQEVLRNNLLKESSEMRSKFYAGDNGVFSIKEGELYLALLGGERSEKYHGLTLEEVTSKKYPNTNYMAQEQSFRRVCIHAIYEYIMKHLPDAAYTDQEFELDINLLKDILQHATSTASGEEKLIDLQFSPVGIPGFMDRMAQIFILVATGVLSSELLLQFTMPGEKPVASEYNKLIKWAKWSQYLHDWDPIVVRDFSEWVPDQVPPSVVAFLFIAGTMWKYSEKMREMLIEANQPRKGGRMKPRYQPT